MATRDSAQFLPCEECGKHGFIFMPGLSSTIPFFSKEFGLEIVDMLRENGHINEEDACSITMQITNSQLVESFCDEDLYVLQKRQQSKNVLVVHEQGDVLLEQARRASRARMN
ncbi:MAG: hypothetical protein CO184_01005 [Candidatus Zambryskibacteria bacterium CG_4_9_14_3_um_filter_40_16]|uniref:Uncharacterized protein n=1 Tax=Candidatus Zambryskibacteria bacterium CG_4_9_14_3_um_filter_40_16 TaxID=1975111 RepID=A0A2M7WUL3_9BACT|nr:MAG: hypothetical protein CO184_01005 [Candidatus Zambryskibacteria bacterium CG_4_9_14_3_um_filter_40_16]